MENSVESLENQVSKRTVNFKLTDLIPCKGYSEFLHRNDTPDLVRDYGDLGYIKLITSATFLLSLNIAYTAAAIYGTVRAINDLGN